MDENYERDLKIVRAIYAETCEKFEAEMYACALAESHGQPLGEFAELLAHLAHCERCSQTYQALKQMIALEASDGWVEPDEIPLLPPIWREQPASEVAIPLNQRIYGNVQAWMDRQGETITRLKVNLATLFDFSEPQLQLRTKHSTSDDSQGESRGEMYIDPSDIPLLHDANLHITAEKDPIQKDHYLLRVELTIASRWPDYSNIVVVLHLPDEQKLTQMTSTSGLAELPQLSREQIVHGSLEVRLSNP